MTTTIIESPIYSGLDAAVRAETIKIAALGIGGGPVDANARELMRRIDHALASDPRAPHTANEPANLFNLVSAWRSGWQIHPALIRAMVAAGFSLSPAFESGK